MEIDVSLDTEQQFWDEIQEIFALPCDSENLIDIVLRSYLSLAAKYKDDYLRTEHDISRCLFELFASEVFGAHTDYVRKQIIYGLLQEDDPKALQLIASFLLLDGRQNEATLQIMNEVGAFPRLLELLQVREREDLNRLLMDVLYEMSRIQRVKIEDLVLVDDDFVQGLFELVDDLSYDADDPYHYPVIRVLLVLNEQFMISALDPVNNVSLSNPLTNKIMKTLSVHGNLYKTFGENIILLINREAETSLQLLTLKLLYLIFTTPSTYEYFYTNDLHVLVDILIRNLLDLPEEAAALRHTYLRVLYPLLAHTQLKDPPHYKRDELVKMLNTLVHGQFPGGQPDYERILHFEDADETTRRLVMRCATVDWLQATEATVLELPAEKDAKISRSHVETAPTVAVAVAESEIEVPKISLETGAGAAVLPAFRRTDEKAPPKTDMHRRTYADRLGMHLEPASSSSLSVQEIASQREKPGVITPSRTGTCVGQASAQNLKARPEPPRSRRSRGRRATPGESAAQPAIQMAEKPEHEMACARSVMDKSNAVGVLSTSPVALADQNRTTQSPPAVPPPRRSTHYHHHCSSHHSQPQNQDQTQLVGREDTDSISPPATGHGQKPEPPKTRRWGREKRVYLHPEEETPGGSFIDAAEEAVPSVSLGRE